MLQDWLAIDGYLLYVANCVAAVVINCVVALLAMRLPRPLLPLSRVNTWLRACLDSKCNIRRRTSQGRVGI